MRKSFTSRKYFTLVEKTRRILVTLKKHFTLVELLMVCVVIAILAGISIGALVFAQDRMARVKCEAIIAKIQTAMENYKSKSGYYIQQTTAGTFFVDDDTTTPNFRDFFDYQAMRVKDTVIYYDVAYLGYREYFCDPYGNAIYYQCPGTNNRTGFDLYSAGPDKSYTATTDNIANF